jgi:hypothetical protein
MYGKLVVHPMVTVVTAIAVPLRFPYGPEILKPTDLCSFLSLCCFSPQEENSTAATRRTAYVLNSGVRFWAEVVGDPLYSLTVMNYLDF